jgi:hypothetical protein
MATRKRKTAVKAKSPARGKAAVARSKADRPKVPQRARPRAALAKVPPLGPVTLAEAKVLTQATIPKAKAKAALRKGPPETASPRAVGAERKKLERAQRDEIKERIREYKATMALMKKRGARKPKAKAGPKAAAFAPLQIFAEGDSWFHYPVPFFGGSIIPRLQSKLGVPILNLAKAGDEVRYMLGVEQRQLIAQQLIDGCPAGGPWDVMLFSGGGNDIVDNPMALWIRDFDATVPPADLIHTPRFDHALALVRAGYEDLIALRDAHSPTTHLVFHAYDFAIPDGRGICNLGPWLEPTFDLRQFPLTGSSRFAVVKEMLLRFAALLTDVATAPNVTFLNAQGTLAPQASSWHNELHPKGPGFDAFAAKFHAKLKALFPTRVA